MKTEGTPEFLEQQAEQAALPFVYGASFTDCLRLHGIEPTVVAGEKFFAHQIESQWTAFLASQARWVKREEQLGGRRRARSRYLRPEVVEPLLITGVADRLGEQMFDWITNRESYELLSTGEGASWLRLVIRFVVYRRIMESKYRQWCTTGRGFADPVVGSRVAEVYRFQYEMGKVTKLIRSSIFAQKDQQAEDWEKRLAERIIAGIFDLLSTDRLRGFPALELLGEGEARKGDQWRSN